jgi:nicotinamidase-related amidase
MTSQRYRLDSQKAGLLVIDVQEKLYPHLDRAEMVGSNIIRCIEGFKAIRLPIVVTEQYPSGLGNTIEGLRDALGSEQEYHAKTAFSCMGDSTIRDLLCSGQVTQWVLVGIEAHVCVLQTALDLLEAGRQVVIANDCITSRSIYNFSTAIAEMRDFGARISSLETVLFELVKDSKAPPFRQISELVKAGV